MIFLMRVLFKQEKSGESLTTVIGLQNVNE